MKSDSIDRSFRTFVTTGDPAAMARVFDGAAPELLRVAHHLASGKSSAAAEDLVQSTFLTAIESAATHDASRPVLPWLVGILANHARVARRRARRPLDRDRLAKPVQDADPARVAEHREFDARLVATLDALAAPYRMPLRLHLLDGLTPAEIAHRLERPHGTVRAQLSRGLDQLRARLPVTTIESTEATPTPRAGRGLQAVRAAVLARCGADVIPATLPAAPAPLEPLAASAPSTKVALVALVFAALTATGWMLGRDRPEETKPIAATGTTASDAGSGTTPAAVAASEPDNPSTPTRSLVREVVAADRAPAVQAETAPSAPRSTGAIEVRVVHASDGRPAPGVAVLCQRPDAVPSFVDRLDARRTDASGRVRFDGLDPGRFALTTNRTSHPVHVTLTQPDGASAEIRIEAGVHVEGTVVDATGNPVPAAEVMVDDGLGGLDFATASDASGRFRLSDLPRGVSICARRPGHVDSLRHAVHAAIGSTQSIECALRGPARRITGTVLGTDGSVRPGALVAIVAASDLHPAAAASQSAPRAGATMLATDARGRFELLTAPIDAFVIVAHPRRGDADETWNWRSVTAGRSDSDLTVELTRGCSVHGRITNEGKPIAGALLSAWHDGAVDEIGFLLNLFGHVPTVSDTDGRYVLSGLRPGEHRLALWSPQLRLDHSVTLEIGENYEWNPTDASGASLELEFIRPPDPHGRRAPRSGQWMAFLMREDPSPGTPKSAGANAVQLDGRVRFAGLTQEPYTVILCARIDDNPRNMLTIATRDGVLPRADAIRIELDPRDLPTASLRGRLRRAGQPASDLRVVAIRASSHFANIVETISQADGTFEFPALTRGDYSIQIANSPDDSGRAMPRRSVNNATLHAEQSLDLGVLKIDP